MVVHRMGQHPYFKRQTLEHSTPYLEQFVEANDVSVNNVLNNI